MSSLVSYQRKPEWLKKKLPSSPCFGRTKSFLENKHLNTVCEEARCPNRWECFSKGTATFLIMGPYCTRDCRFCSVKHKRPEPLRDDELYGILEFIQKMSLNYVVITSVTRDDLQDGGASHFAKAIRLIKQNCPNVGVEVLVPDFLGKVSSLKRVLEENPDVFNHNIETVKSLYKKVRPGADYKRSIGLLKKSKELCPNIPTKSGIMVGLGETKKELIDTFYDLRYAEVDILTIGQYLRPTKKHIPVSRYYHPDEFVELEKIGKKMGFKQVISGVFVRSSYNAYDAFINLK